MSICQCPWQRQRLEVANPSFFLGNGGKIERQLKKSISSLQVRKNIVIFAYDYNTIC